MNLPIIPELDETGGCPWHRDVIKIDGALGTYHNR